jgi:hypothetical protein
VRYLAAAMMADDDGLFEEYLRWLEAVLVRRRVPRRAVVAGLDSLEPLVSVVAPRAGLVLAHGREALVTVP